MLLVLSAIVLTSICWFTTFVISYYDYHPKAPRRLTKVSLSKNKSVVAWILLILLSLIWGSSFILIKKSLVAFDPLQLGAGRIVISFLAFTPLFLFHFSQINWKRFWPLLVVGFCGSALPAFLYASAQTEIPSGIAGLLNALTPIFAFLLSIIAFGKSFSGKQLLGISLGFVGTAIVFLSKEDISVSFSYYHGLLLSLIHI